MTREEQILKAGIEYTIANKPKCIAGDNFKDLADIFNKNPDFEAGAMWADAHPHWISVEDELPPKEAVEDKFITDMSIDVLATDGKTIHMCFYDHNLERWLCGDFWQLDNISYWMYLPSVEHLKNK